MGCRGCREVVNGLYRFVKVLEVSEVVEKL